MKFIKDNFSNSNYIFIVLLGFLINLIKVTIIPGVNLFFGGICAFYLLKQERLIPVILAALVINIPTYFYWNNPYVMFEYTIEALVVWYLIRKHQKNMVSADLLFWFFAIPFIIISFSVLLKMDLLLSLFIGVKDATNGILNIIISSLFVLFFIDKRKIHENTFPIKNVIFVILIACVFIPMFVTVNIYNYVQYNRNINRANQELTYGTIQISNFIESKIEDKIFRLKKLATNFENFEELQRMKLNGTSSGEFYGLNKQGELFSLNSDSVNPILSATIQRDFREGLLTQEAVRPINDGTKNLLLLNQPLLKDGRIVGSIIEILKTDEILRIINYSHLEIEYTLINSEGNVITRIDTPSFDKEESVNKYFNNRFVLLDQTSYHLKFNNMPLELIAQTSFNSIYEEAQVVYMRSMLLLLLAIFFSIIVANLFTNLIANRIIELTEITADIPNKIINNKNLEWPISKILELNILFNNFRHTSAVLQTYFDQLQSINQNLITEIEEKKRAQKKYSILFNNIRDAVYVYSLKECLKKEFIEFNDEFMNITGYTRNEILSLSPEDILSPMVENKREELIEEMKQKGYIRIEGTLKDKYSVLHPVEFNARVFIHNDEQMVISIARDISAQIEAQQALQEQIELHSLTANLSRDLNNLEKDINLIIEDALRKLTMHYECNFVVFFKAELSGDTAVITNYWSNWNSDIFSEIPLEYSAQNILNWFAKLRELKPVAYEKGNGQLEEEILDRLGIDSGLVVPLLNQGKFAGGIALFTIKEKTMKQRQEDSLIVIGNLFINALVQRDKINQIQTSEAQMRAMISAIPDAVFRLNSEYRILEAHLSRKYYDYPPEFLIGKPIKDTGILSSEDASELSILISETLETETLKTFEFKAEFNGITLYEEARIISINSNEVLVLVRDITASRLLELQMAKMTAEIEKANRIASIGIMGSSIAHEINQPLQAIQMIASSRVYMGQQGKKFDSETIFEEFSTISEQVDRISNIIYEIRNLAQGIARDFELIHINQLLTEVIFQNTKANSNWISIKTNFDPQNPTIYGNKTQIKQVIQNLLNNSIEALNTCLIGEKHIVVSTQLESMVLAIEVSDNGKGIPPAMVSRIFEPFYSLKEKGSNMGLGLVIANQIIALHRGTLKFIKNDEKGATFRIELPLETGERIDYEDITG